MKINRIKTAKLVELARKLKEANQTESAYFRHICFEISRRQK